MRTFSILFLVLIYSACSETPVKTESAEAVSVYNIDSFLAKFTEIAFDSLKVYTTDQVDADTSFYKGNPLDSVDAPFIATLYGNDVFESSREYLSQFYACYKFKIDEERMGLIVRCPSEYVSSFLEVFEYNCKTSKVKHLINLSELWGDAGDSYERCSYLFRAGKGIGVYQYNMSSYDHSVEDEKDSTVDKWYNHYTIRISEGKFDTLSRDTGHYLPYWMKR
ncbi:MAG: hypothetical protein ACKOXF_01810 [Chitinophagaceae bacterium]